jgi:3-oxoadipate enol-lactonase
MNDSLVLIHGLGNHSGVWQPQYELSDTYNLITPDLHGNTIHEMARNVIDTLPPHAHICGISMGGLVAQEIYRQRPDIVASLILVNTFSYVPYWTRDCILRSWQRTLDSMDDDEYIRNAARACIHSDDPDKLHMAEQSFDIDREVFIRAASDAVRVNYMSILPFITVPTLVIGSRYDKVVPWYAPWSTCMLIPGSRYHMLDTGHLCNIDAPDEFNDVIRGFIRRYNRIYANQHSA